MSSSIKKTREFYDLRGEHALKCSPKAYGKYGIKFNGPFELAESYIKERRNPQASQNFLDLCCGTGIHSIFPAKLGYHTYGNDISPKSIAAAKKLAQESKVGENCQFTCQSAEDFLNNGRLYDIIFISGSLYYLNADDIIEKAYRALVPNGSFIIVETNGSNSILNMYRHIKNLFIKNRDEATRFGLIRIAKLDEWKRNFKYSKIHYFDFFTLLAPFFKFSSFLAKSYSKWARKMDAFFFKLPFARYFCFKFMLVIQKK